jgi:hypothetical protein
MGKIPSLDENRWEDFLVIPIHLAGLPPVFKKTYIFIKSYLELL